MHMKIFLVRKHEGNIYLQDLDVGKGIFLSLILKSGIVGCRLD
jgi:hypothetical protein